MKRLIGLLLLVAAVGFVMPAASSAAPERTTYHCVQDPFVTTALEVVEAGQTVHVEQHGYATFTGDLVGRQVVDAYFTANLVTNKAVLHGSFHMTLQGGGGFDATYTGDGTAAPPEWTAQVVGHGFGAWDGWQMRGTQSRKLGPGGLVTTYELVLFLPGS